MRRKVQPGTANIARRSWVKIAETIQGGSCQPVNESQVQGSAENFETGLQTGER